MLKFPQEEHPVRTPQRPCAPGDAAAGRSWPAQVFQPAVLLSPPRQKDSPELSPLHNSKISLAKVDLEVCVVCYYFNVWGSYYLWSYFLLFYSTQTPWPYSWNILLLHPGLFFLCLLDFLQTFCVLQFSIYRLISGSADWHFYLVLIFWFAVVLSLWFTAHCLWSPSADGVILSLSPMEPRSTRNQPVLQTKQDVHRLHGGHVCGVFRIY